MTTQNKAVPEHELLTRKSFMRSLNALDWGFALVIAAIAYFAQTHVGHHMDIYEMVILWASAGIAVFLGWFFKPMRWYIVLCLAFARLPLRSSPLAVPVLVKRFLHQ